jgi:hypothetical protein
MATKREQLEKLVHDMKAFADECDAKGELTAEDREKLDKYGKDVNELVASIKAEATASGTLDVAKAFLGDLAGKPGQAAPSDEPEVHTSGIVNPKGMTLGEAFVKSPVFEDFLKQFKGNDGRIREVTNIKSASYDVAGFGAKALITGASDRYAAGSVPHSRASWAATAGTPPARNSRVASSGRETSRSKL